MDNTKSFSLNDIESVITEDSIDYAVARLAVLSDGGNSHKVNITKEILMRDGKTILSKPVLAKYNKFKNDVMSHETDEIMIGYIPENQEPQFVVNELGETVMYVDAVISKIYATDVYNLFTKDNFRNASVEMSVINERPSELNDGSTDIDGIYIFGITVLGKTIKGSDKNAHITITQFSEQEATEFYTKEKALKLSDELRKFANSLQSLESKDNNDERTNPMELENIKQLSEEDDNKDVVMSEGGEEPKEEPKSEESKEMADPKEEEPKSEDDKKDEEPKEDKKEMSCGGETEKMGCGEDKKFSLEQFASKEVVETLSDEMAEVIKMESADDVIKKFAEIVEQNKELSEKVEKLSAQNDELVEFQTKAFEAERDARVNDILAEVKGDLEVEKFAELEEEAKSVSLDSVDAFANKVKAFAYEASKNKVTEPKNEEGIMLMASPDAVVKVEKDSDVFSRLSKKYK